MIVGHSDRKPLHLFPGTFVLKTELYQKANESEISVRGYLYYVNLCHTTFVFHLNYKINEFDIPYILERIDSTSPTQPDCNGTRTHRHLVCKRKFNRFVKLAKRLSCVKCTYLYGAFDCIFLSWHVRVSEWIHTL